MLLHRFVGNGIAQTKSVFWFGLLSPSEAAAQVMGTGSVLATGGAWAYFWGAGRAQGYAGRRGPVRPSCIHLSRTHPASSWARQRWPWAVGSSRGVLPAVPGSRLCVGAVSACWNEEINRNSFPETHWCALCSVLPKCVFALLLAAGKFVTLKITE